MPARSLLGGAFKVLGSAKLSITDATTTSFTPDINLTTNANYANGDRVAVVVAVTTAGTTSAITVVVQDADDANGSIGMPAAALTDGTLALSTGDGYTVIGVRPQSARPWLRVRITSDSAADTHECTVIVLAVPAGL